jgi:hypothetical protein
MGPIDAFERIATTLGKPAFEARVLEARADFQQRTGAFGSEDPWFEARSRAFWDDALTSGGLAELVYSALPDEARSWVAPLARAHRGLFVVTARDDEAVVVRDLLSGAELFVDQTDPGTSDALVAAVAPFDGRVVAGGLPVVTALLPGAVYHPEDAKEPIAKVLETARARGLERGQTLDALLRMELSLCSLSRVKASYAYRAEALARAK